MKTKQLIIVLFALIYFTSTVLAYDGFNRYYYTENYYPTTYYTTPAAAAYSNYYYPNYYAGYYKPYYYPTYYTEYYYPSYTTYYYPSYSGVTIYSNSTGWGVSISRGTVCGYYGYC